MTSQSYPPVKPRRPAVLAWVTLAEATNMTLGLLAIVAGITALVGGLIDDSAATAFIGLGLTAFAAVVCSTVMAVLSYIDWRVKSR